MKHLFRLSGIGQMLLHKCGNTIRCALSGQDKGVGRCDPLCSKNTAADGDDDRDCFDAVYGT